MGNIQTGDKSLKAGKSPAKSKNFIKNLNRKSPARESKKSKKGELKQSLSEKPVNNTRALSDNYAIDSIFKTVERESASGAADVSAEAEGAEARAETGAELVTGPTCRPRPSCLAARSTNREQSPEDSADELSPRDSREQPPQPPQPPPPRELRAGDNADATRPPNGDRASDKSDNKRRPTPTEESSTDSVFSDSQTPVAFSAEINQCYYSAESTSTLGELRVGGGDAADRDESCGGCGAGGDAMPLHGQRATDDERHSPNKIVDKKETEVTDDSPGEDKDDDKIMGSLLATSRSRDGDPESRLHDCNHDFAENRLKASPGHTSFTLSRHRRVELPPNKLKEACLLDTTESPEREHRRHASVGEVSGGGGGGGAGTVDSNVLRKVASLTLEQAGSASVAAASAARPKFVPEKLHFHIYEKFEGQMLLNWFVSSVFEDDYMKSLLSVQDLRALGIQYCTHLLAAGVLRQISDRDAPVDGSFRPDMMYYWTYTDTPTAQPATPGRIQMLKWPPNIQNTEKSKCISDGSKDLVIKDDKENSEFYDANESIEPSLNIDEAKSIINQLQQQCELLKLELERYKTLSQIHTLTQNAHEDFANLPKTNDGKSNLLEEYPSRSEQSTLISKREEPLNNKFTNKPVIKIPEFISDNVDFKNVQCIGVSNDSCKHENSINKSKYILESPNQVSRLTEYDSAGKRSEDMENFCKLNKCREKSSSKIEENAGARVTNSFKQNRNDSLQKINGLQKITNDSLITKMENTSSMLNTTTTEINNQDLVNNQSRNSNMFSSESDFTLTNIDDVSVEHTGKMPVILHSAITTNHGLKLDKTRTHINNDNFIDQTLKMKPKTLSKADAEHSIRDIVKTDNVNSMQDRDPSAALLPGMELNCPPDVGFELSQPQATMGLPPPQILGAVPPLSGIGPLPVVGPLSDKGPPPPPMSGMDPSPPPMPGMDPPPPPPMPGMGPPPPPMPGMGRQILPMPGVGPTPHPFSGMGPPPPPMPGIGSQIPQMPCMGPPPPPMPGMGPPPPPMPGMGPPSPPMPGMGPPPPPMPGMGPPPSPMPGIGPPPPPMPGMGPPPPPMPGMGPPSPPMPGMGPPPPPMPGMGPPPPPMPGIGPPPPPMPGMGPPPPPLSGMELLASSTTGLPPPPMTSESSCNQVPPTGIGPPPPPMSGPVPFPAPPAGGWNTQRATLRKTPVVPSVPMKPLYWTRILAPQQTAPVVPEPVAVKPLWVEIEEDRLDNIDEFADLFSRQVVTKKPVKKKIETKTKVQPVKILDSKRSQNVGILAQSLHVEFSEIENAIYNFDTSVVSLEALNQIYELRATEDELALIKEHIKQKSEIPLDKPEAFLHELSGIPNFAERISCFMFQAEFEDSISTIMHKLDNLKHTCEFLITNENLKKLFAIILTLGNYMNGGNGQRGQADGFGLEILSKLRDVKSKESTVTLLHFIVRTYMRRRGGALSEECTLPVPEPGDVARAAALDFPDAQAHLTHLAAQLRGCREKMKKVVDTEEEIQCRNDSFEDATSKRSAVFKDKMATFLEVADEKLKTENENLEECRNKFIATVRFYQYTPKSGKPGDCEPKDFFALWLSFCTDFKDIFKKEQQFALKERLKETKKRKEDIKATAQPKKEGGLKARMQKLAKKDTLH